MRRRWLTSGRARRRGLRLALLALPALFWSAVFASVAGAWPLRGLVEAVPNSLQAAVMLACPLVAMLLGAAAVREEAGAGLASPGRLMLAAGAALFAFAAYVSLGGA
jgi:hypothetical protein